MSLQYKTIFLIGHEGSGKTTQAIYLYWWLRKKGKNPIQVKFTDENLLAFLFKILLLHLRSSNTYYSTYKQMKYIDFDPNLIRKVFKFWCYLNCACEVLMYLLKIKLMKVLKFTVISEGHPIHAIINMYNIAVFHKIPVTNNIFAKFLLRLIKTREPLIILHAPYDITVNRYIHRKSLIEPIWYISIQKKFLKYIINENPHSLLIDTAKNDILSTFQKIKDYLSSELKCLR